MKHILSYFLLFILLAALLSACEKPKVTEDTELRNHLYSNSIDTIHFNSDKYFLEAYLYRDFFPGGPIPAKRPLIAIVSLVNTDSVKISPVLDITKLYVINESLTWISIPANSNDQYIPAYKLTKISNDGPEWETGILVDVVIEVNNTITKDKYLLISRDITIDRVE